MGGGGLCGFVNGCRVDCLDAMFHLPFVLADIFSDDWTEGQIWHCHVCHLDEHVTESLMDSARLFCLRLSCYR